MRPSQIRSHATVAASISLALTLAACGGASDGTGTNDASPTVVVAPNFSAHHNDRDNDGDHNDDDGKVLYYGHAADAVDRQSSTDLVNRYFAAAAKANGATGCTMLVPLVAETVAEDDGHATGLQGTTCAVVLSKLFALHHRELATKDATLKVIEVRVQDTKELIVLDFPTIPEVRQITARQIGSSWKLMDLLDGIIE